MDDQTDRPETGHEPPAARGAAVPTAENLDRWIGQNKTLIRRSRVTMVAIAVAFAIAVGSATSNVFVLNKLDERAATNRELIVQIGAGVENTQKLLDFAGRIESPETQAAADAKVVALVDRLATQVDCNTRRVFQDVMDDVYGKGAVDVACPSSPPVAGSTTTTTVTAAPGTAAPTSTSLVPSG